MSSKHPHLKILENMDIPEDVDKVAEKLELYIIRGRGMAMEHFWDFVGKHFEGEELGASHYERLHLRVARLLLRCMHIRRMGIVLEEVPAQFRNHEQYKLLNHLWRHFECVETRRVFFPLNVPFESRKDGPHLFKQSEDRPIVRWAAGRVDAIEDEILFTLIQHFEGSDSTGARLQIPFGTTEKWGSDRTDLEVEEGDYFEIAMYEDEAEDEAHIKWWGREWDGWEKLIPLQIDPNRYLRYSGWVRGGETFIEKCLRGETQFSEIDDYVDKWHEGEPWWLRGWGLADYLGMVPEEYEQWVQDPSCLSQILEDRMAMWKEEGVWSDEWAKGFSAT